MDDAAGGHPFAHPFAVAIAQVADGVDAGLAASTVGMTQVQARVLLVDLEVQERRVHALRLRLVRESVSHDRTVEPSGTGGGPGAARSAAATSGTAVWMRSALRVTSARAHGEVRAAALTDPAHGDLRELGVALAAGTTSSAHVQVACRAMARIPRHLVVAQREKLSTALTEHATSWPPEAADLLAGHLLGVLDPDRSDRYDPAALDRRSLHLGTDSTGMLITRGQHDPAAGAFLKTAIDLLTSFDRHLPHPATTPDANSDPGAFDGGAAVTIGAGDVRSSPQRRVDALDTLVRAGVAHLAGCATGGIGTAMSRLIITTTLDQIATITSPTTEAAGGAGANLSCDGDDADTCSHGRSAALGRGTSQVGAPGSAACQGHGPITPGFLQFAACDAVIDRVLLDTRGAVVSMTSASRYATPAMIRALIARDGGCAFPGCTAPASLTDAHHVKWWSRGGVTEVANLVLLCGRHHRLIHTREWDVTMRAGLPWFRPPHHQDPHRSWIRNTYTDATHRTRRLAQHLTTHDRPDRPDRPDRWSAQDPEPHRDTG